MHLLTTCCDFDLEIPNNSDYTPFVESIQSDFYEIHGILGCHYVQISRISWKINFTKFIMSKFKQFLDSNEYKNGMDIVNQIKTIKYIFFLP